MADKKTEINLEREYIIPLRNKVMRVPSYKRAKKAIKTIKEFIAKHMQVRDRDLNKIKLNKYLNQMIWRRGIKTPPHKIKVKATKEGEIVKVEAYELSEKIKFQKQREEKIETLSKLDQSKEKKKPEEKIIEPEKTEEKKAEELEKKKTVIEAEQKYEKQKARERKQELSAEKRPAQKKKEHSKGMGTGH
jgi:large subunit ribosomal protein L31e